jgi:hypothetical protein
VELFDSLTARLEQTVEATSRSTEQSILWALHPQSGLVLEQDDGVD